jgi:hypothetical protein
LVLLGELSTSHMDRLFDSAPDVDGRFDVANCIQAGLVMAGVVHILTHKPKSKVHEIQTLPVMGAQPFGSEPFIHPFR